MWSSALMSASLLCLFSSRRRHTRCLSDWSSDVCSSDLARRSRATITANPSSDIRRRFPDGCRPFYDLGGQGVTYNDSDAENQGSVKLNTGDKWVDRFRKDEGVDISYTKTGIDKSVDGADEK